MTAFRGATATDAGRVRSSNQDLAFATEELLAVADGMGGHVGGEVAARIALDTLRHAFGESRDASGLIGATNEANRAVFELSERDPQLRGMGTTLTAAAIIRPGRKLRLVVTNVGDSRAYLLSGTSFSQLTEDHSLVEEMVRHGELTAAEAAVHPHRHVLTRALGIDRTVSVDSWELDPVPGSRLLLCSDGLTNEVTDHDIAAVLTTAADPEHAASQLVELALEHGGSDNVTVVVADLDDTLPDPSGPQRRGRGVVGERHSPATSLPGEARERTVAPRPRRDRAERVLSVRVVLFVLAFVGVLGGAAGFVGWYVRASWFVGVDRGHVAVFRGRPGGFLWFHPEVVSASQYTLAQVFPPNVPALESGMLEPSLTDAERIVAALGNEHHSLALPSVDTSSALGVAGTTTSLPPVTTTTAAKRRSPTTTTQAPTTTTTTSTTNAPAPGTGATPGAPTPVNAIPPPATTSTNATAPSSTATTPPTSTTTTAPTSTTAPPAPPAT